MLNRLRLRHKEKPVYRNFSFCPIKTQFTWLDFLLSPASKAIAFVIHSHRGNTWSSRG